MIAYMKLFIWGFIITISLAEWVLTYNSILGGLFIHGFAFIANIMIYWKNWEKFTLHGGLLILSFSYISLNRLVGISIIGEMNEILLILIFVNAPLLICLIECLLGVGIRLNEYFMETMKYKYREMLIAVTGVFFGLIEKNILAGPAISWFDFRSFAFASIAIIIFTGFYEELLFRGVILRYVADISSRGFAIIYSSLLFAIMHLSWMSATDLVFVFLVGVFYASVYMKTRNLMGISISHGITNIILFLF
ncbi:lysostaphin resistance A-like protein [Candidatus Altiarchaeota archaeon]